MRSLLPLLLALPLSTVLADDYDGRFRSTVPPQPAAPKELPSEPAFRITPDSALMRPQNERKLDSGNPLLDSDERRERDNCWRINQRIRDQGKFPSFGCD
ncbi:MAG: hypothetical protein CTR55_21255 [Pseudomonas sp.]|uniref:hypothetical protein n=1 Tax=Pseudomonas sp. TaxID=306 RepID=UPI000CA7097B|nr:hypothetical protein [Pseudomonas sp.]PJI47068.1 MAG: hypothetical protein CTR55_21255 [Pseudomonas sp.]